MIYTIRLSSNIASTDFVSLFPFDLTFSNSVFDEYYIIGRASNTYQSYYYQKEFTYMQGDIALLKDNTYIIFKEASYYEKESIYIGNIMNFENILTNIASNTKIQSSESDTNKFFESKTLCSPYIVGINGEKTINLPLDKYYEKGFKTPYYYGIINFSTRGTEKLNGVPPIYLNNTYLGDYCSVENDKYSIKCTIKDSVWYHVDAPKPVMYRVNELYEGCYGPVYTGITIYVSGESLYINLLILFFILLILL